MFVYLLESIATGWRYIGQTQNLANRLQQHNAGKEKSTKRYVPLILLGYIKFSDRKEMAFFLRCFLPDICVESKFRMGLHPVAIDIQPRCGWKYSTSILFPPNTNKIPTTP